MLELAGLRVRLGEFHLRDLDLQVGDGEYFVLLGPSGVGKTVLLELIAGLLRPDGGRIIHRGRDMTNLVPEERNITIVYQDYALFPHLRVRDNLAYGLRARGVEPGAVAGRVAELAGRIGIDHLLERWPMTLSGGEQQRVALARALAPRPGLVLLDEPLSAIDQGSRLQLRRELRQVQRDDGATFLHVTHDPEEALHLAHRIGVMLDNRIHQVGTPEEVFRRPSDPKVGSFLGIRNILPIDSREERICRVGELEVHVAGLAARQVEHIWIKPEEILLSRDPFASSARNQFRGRVVDWEPAGILLAVNVDLGGRIVTALVTRGSFADLDLAAGQEVLVTFKSSAVHCF